MQKKFVSSLLLVLILNVLVKPLAIFGIDATVQNRVGSEEYGLYFSLLNLSFLFNIVMDLGINNYTTKYVAQYPKAVVGYLGKVLTIRIFLFILYAFITYLSAYVFSYNERQFSLLSILLINQFFVSLIAYFRSHLSGLLFFNQDAIVSILDKFLLIGFCGYLLYSPNTGAAFVIEWFVWVQTLCYGTTALVAGILVLKKTGKPKIKFSVPFSLAIIRKSFPYALLILLMMIYTRVDSIMLERLHHEGKHQAGIYAQGFRILDAFFMFGMLFANLLFPTFSHLIKNNKEDLSKILSVGFRWLPAAAIVIAILSFFNAEWILNLIYTNDTNVSIESFQLLMASFIALSLTLVFGTLLTSFGALKFLNTLSLAGIIINIGLNFAVIPEYGAAGAAFTSLITQTSIALIQMLYVFKNYSFEGQFQITVKLFLLAISLFIISYLIRSYTELIPILPEMMVALILTLSMGLLKPRDFLMMLKAKR